jgi:hypothetical protein
MRTLDKSVIISSWPNPRGACSAYPSHTYSQECTLEVSLQSLMHPSSSICSLLRILIGSDGLPACLIWIHVDDIFLHGPTCEKCTSALKKILDLTVLVGLICRPTKLKPTAQIQKFCGFLYDSVGTPKLRIPDNKVVRSLALLDFLMRGSRAISCRLALAVVIGTLQSLVPATLNDIGASFLHHVYWNIHNENLDNFENIHDFYHSGLALRALAQVDFCWWEQALNSCLREQIQPRDFCTLGVAWGGWDWQWQWW